MVLDFQMKIQKILVNLKFYEVEPFENLTSAEIRDRIKIDNNISASTAITERGKSSLITVNSK